MRLRYLILALLFVPLAARAEVTTQNIKVSFTCAGSAGPYPFSFPLSDAAQTQVPLSLTVTQNGAVLTAGQYVVTPVNNNYMNGGSVALTVACPIGQVLTLQRNTPLTQISRFSDNMPIPMSAIENGLDKLTEIDQELSNELANAGDNIFNANCPPGKILQGVSPAVCVTNAAGTAANPAGVQYQTQANAGGIFGAYTLPLPVEMFGVVCDGADHPFNTSGIQNAFNTALSTGQPVQFPAGTCLTDTITYSGQSFFGAGKLLTFLKGKPGEDVLAGPNSSAMNWQSWTSIHDIDIEVDSTVNAASSAVGGNNTFPDRISGTSGGGGTIGGSIIPLTNPPAIGNVGIGPGYPCTGIAINSGQHNFTGIGDCQFISPGATSPDIIGAPMVINGAGNSGGTLTSTIATITGYNTGTIVGTAGTTVANATGNFGYTFAPPWYFGNCGIALPSSNVAWYGGNPPQNWNIENVIFSSNNPAGIPRANHTCAVFMQVQGYAWRYRNIIVTSFYGGLIEALPNFGSGSFPWSPDTFSYDNVDLSFNTLPMITYNGASRTLRGVNIYGGEALYTRGLFQLAPNNQGGNISTNIDGLFFECFHGNIGEDSRFTGQVTMQTGGGLNECGPVAGSYSAWYVNNSTSNIYEISGLNLYGNNNTINHVNTGAVVNDYGYNNKITLEGQAAGSPPKYLTRVKAEPFNTYDGGSMLGGNPTAPFASGSELLVTCAEFNWAWQTSTPTGCTVDTSAGNIPQTYSHVLASNFPAGVGFGFNHPAPLGKDFDVGDRIPQGPVNIVVSARCNAQCLVNVVAQDITTGGAAGASQILQFSTSWGTPQTLYVNLTGAHLGDYINVSLEPVTPAWGTTVTSMDVQSIGVQPNATPPSDFSPCSYTFFNSPPNYVSPPAGCYFDSSSPTSFSIDLPTPSAATYQIIGPGFQLNTTVPGGSIPAVPTTFAFQAKSSASDTVTVSITCDGVTFPESNGTWSTTTTPTLFYIFAKLTSTCGSSAHNISINFSGFAHTLTLSGFQMFPQPVVTPQPTAAGQVPVATLIGGVYYYLPGNNSTANITGGALGSLPYQSGAGATTFLASPTTNGHTFVPAWQPTGSAIVPTAIDLGTYLGTNLTASLPLVATPSTLGTAFSCPTCGSSSGGTATVVNSGGALASLNINATAPVADANYLALLPKISGANAIIEAPYATNSAFGVVEGDNSTLSISSGVISCTTGTSSQLGCLKPDGIVVQATAGALTVNPATSSALGVVKPDGTIITDTAGAITVAKGSSSAFGVVEVDNSTITASAGVISAGATMVRNVCPSFTEALSTSSIAPGGSVTITDTTSCTAALTTDSIRCQPDGVTFHGVVGYDVTLNSGNVVTIDPPEITATGTIKIITSSSSLNTLSSFTPGSMTLRCHVTR